MGLHPRATTPSGKHSQYFNTSTDHKTVCLKLTEGVVGAANRLRSTKSVEIRILIIESKVIRLYHPPLWRPMIVRGVQVRPTRMSTPWATIPKLPRSEAVGELAELEVLWQHWIFPVSQSV